MSIEQKFAQIGAKVDVRMVDGWWPSSGSPFTLDVKTDKKKQEVFDLRINRKRADDIELSVVDAKPDDRHLLLLVKEQHGFTVDKRKFLCGHDEFHWFAAPVADSASTVSTAKESLKPRVVRDMQHSRGGGKKSVRAGVKRQGEWFFIPKQSMKVPHNQILKDEPVQRGRNKPHLVSELYRTGGRTVYADHDGHVLSIPEFQKLVRSGDPRSKYFRMAREGARVYGRGRVTHPDHSVLKLDCWHEIVPNAESLYSTESLRFID